MNSKFAIDKTAFAVTALDEAGGEKSYWLSQPPYECLQAVETLCRINYGHDQSSARLQKVLEIARRTPR